MVARTTPHQRPLVITMAFLLAPSSMAFGSRALRGMSARNIGVIAATARHRPVALSRHRTAVFAVRGGDNRRRCRDFNRGSSSSCFELKARPSSSTSSSASSTLALPPSFNDRKEEVTIALRSVFEACRVTRRVQPTSSDDIQTISKQDASPVTVGDFASQAVALQILHNHFPGDMFIAEEGSEALQNDVGLLDRVWGATNSVRDEGGALLKDKAQLLSVIDYGQGLVDGQPSSSASSSSSSQLRRVWCLDPIDGTKGFLRGRLEGGQYCIALTLIEDGTPVVSVLGCPNLPLPSNAIAAKTNPYGLWSSGEVQESEMNHSSNKLFSDRRGSLFVAVDGGGCYEVPLHRIEELLHADSTTTASSSLPWTKLHVTPNDGVSKPPSQARFCLGVERGFSDPKGVILQIAEKVHGVHALTIDGDGLKDIKNSLRMDGQAKYGLLARGEAECFLRLPKDGYIDWVWDVAPGYLILKESGGTMTDLDGKPIDFSNIGVDRHAKLPDHVRGILGSCGGSIHDALVKAHAQVQQL